MTTEHPTPLLVATQGNEMQPKRSIQEEIHECERECKKHFNELLAFTDDNETVESKDFRKFESSLFKQVLLMGKLLTQLYFKKKAKEILVKQ